ncbi:tRNA (guanosine(37)-N1)-methyltransferase TrmD [Xylocopilactobacillus apicola]|uniref:tRNA (guanine-N(1)-)-methyltransferase n=1 Tax=Xylocopilactobacillus apicola TaxID=2932184 RepID=A0AAU9D7A3_9LACO|nr:tRNA (guanosine(37)-N1)-methyltransferase TrmD [Xylocopilactobacillus apicola]BDR58190.1 tRNA (guanine-N(1)-)-methyltransferase [Xylocopilactobacillus apicola]
MKIDVLTLFPEMFAALNSSVIGKALETKLVELNLINFREFTENKQRHVDDTPFGGGPGMLLMAQPLFSAYDTIDQGDTPRTIILDPGGRRFDQKFASELATEKHLVFICGHYEGFDERVKTLATDEVSLGDFVLSGGELVSMVMMDSVIRLLPGVLGNNESAQDESFANGLLEYPQYTRPREFRGLKVPDILVSGDHQAIRDYQLQEAIKRTKEKRPDLYQEFLAHESSDN